jgi:hypothetical protein
MTHSFVRKMACRGMAAGLVFFAGGAWAAHLEIGPMGGWRFGGSFDDPAGHTYTAEPSGSWGGVMDIYGTPDAALEVLFSRQESSVRSGGTVPVLLNYTLDHYQIGGLKEYEGQNLRPFLSGLLGWSHAKAGKQSSDFFSVTLGGGAKYYFTSWLGLRTDLRCHLMFTNSAVAASSGPSGGSISFAGEVFAQGEVAGGLFIAFGGPREPSDEERPLQEFRQRESVPFE